MAKTESKGIKIVKLIFLKKQEFLATAKEDERLVIELTPLQVAYLVNDADVSFCYWDGFRQLFYGIIKDFYSGVAIIRMKSWKEVTVNI